SDPSELFILSLHDALPISAVRFLENLPWQWFLHFQPGYCWNEWSKSPYTKTQLPAGSSVALASSENRDCDTSLSFAIVLIEDERSEEHTSELQSRENLVCR